MSFVKNIILSDKCTLNCPNCPLNKSDFNFDLSYIKNQISKTSQIINIFGGDPLTNNHLKEIIIYLKAQNKHINIFTPAISLPNDLSIFHNCNIFVLLLSIEEETHNILTGKTSAYSSLQKNINSLKSEKIKTIIYHFVTDFVMDSTPELKEFCETNKYFLWCNILNKPFFPDITKNFDLKRLIYTADSKYASYQIQKEHSQYCLYLKNKWSLIDKIRFYFFHKKIMSS